MKKIAITLFSICLLTQVYAQKIELSVQAYSGLFRYSGNATAATSGIYEGQTPKQNGTENPYGDRNGFSYGGAVQAQYVFKGGFIAGLQTGYDVLRSKVNINEYYPAVFQTEFNTFAASQTAVKGSTALQDQSVNLSPYIGYRIKFKNVNIDLMPGADFDFNISSYDKGSALDDTGKSYRTDLKLLKAKTDILLKMGVAASYKRFGIFTSFAHGLTNYGVSPQVYFDNNDNSTVQKPGAYGVLFRFGITYRLL